jgi:ferredoxin-NADP reductase
MIPEWKTASVWFCGPAGFGQAFREDLLAQGLSPGNFHQELFNIR